ncbi:DUF3352 domain-containing protein [Actinopolymorpha alba]|uniref:DUF3352 domain-containing protein n=1 Tax=Actinopolymorpha alba TaxID=533267 RepID=UPI0003A4CAAC|nr:DUF3352 domain-containing protein [Actinopolymorpha alba]
MQPGQPPYGAQGAQPGYAGSPYPGQGPAPSGQPGAGQFGGPGQGGPGQFGGPAQGGPGQFGGPGQGGPASGGPWTPGASGPQGPGPFDPEPKRRGFPRWAIVALAAVLVVVVGGGAWAFTSLRSGGSQPDQILPDNALAYIRIDLNPSAQQKLAVLQFARKFPDAAKRLGEGDDLRKSLFEAIKSEDDDLKDVDYSTDIEPWLGDRLGVAVVPGTDGKETTSVAAVEVKDQDKAKAGIEKLRPKDDKTGFAFTDGYLIIADTQAQADGYATSAKEKPLANNEQFKTDMGALDKQGVLSFWIDAGKLAERTGADAKLPVGAGQTTGRVVGALSFESSYVELSAQAIGTKVPTLEKSGIKLGQLPSSTVAALSVAGAGPAFQQAWPDVQKALQATGGAQVESFMRAAEQQFGIKLPDDLVTLLGDELTLAVDERGLAESLQGQGGSNGMPPLPQIGLRSTTDMAKAKALLPKLDQLVAATGAPIQLGKAEGSDSVAIATAQSYADELVKGGGLGGSETFKTAVPDAEKAQVGLFVDLDKLEKFYLEKAPADQRANLQPLRAVGLSGSSTEEGGTFTLRLLVN